MSIAKILNSLDHSWEREVILSKIKNGSGTNEIVNEFLQNNQTQIKKLKTLLRPEDIDLLSQVEQLSNCEAKLLNTITNLSYLNDNKNNYIINEKKITLKNRNQTNKISTFMINWSNKFVVLALLAISAIALSKQAWA